MLPSPQSPALAKSQSEDEHGERRQVASIGAAVSPAVRYTLNLSLHDDDGGGGGGGDDKDSARQQTSCVSWAEKNHAHAKRNFNCVLFYRREKRNISHRLCDAAKLFFCAAEKYPAELLVFTSIAPLLSRPPSRAHVRPARVTQALV